MLNKYGGKKAHHYPTQNKMLPNIQKHNITLFNKSFLCKGLVAYNSLPLELKKFENLCQKTEEAYPGTGLNAH